MGGGGQNRHSGSEDITPKLRDALLHSVGRAGGKRKATMADLNVPLPPQEEEEEEEEQEQEEEEEEEEEEEGCG